MLHFNRDQINRAVFHFLEIKIGTSKSVRGLVLFWLLCTNQKVLQYDDQENFFNSFITSGATEANLSQM